MKKKLKFQKMNVFSFEKRQKSTLHGSHTIQNIVFYTNEEFSQTTHKIYVTT